jgi:DNA-binding transcriptional MerR regulator
MTEQTYTIGEMCKEFDVTPRSLRFYEQKELLSPIRKGQRRLFTHKDRARLKLILRGKRFGFSLADIRELLEMYYADPTHVTQLTAVVERAGERLEAMKRQRLELDEAIDELTQQIEMGHKMLAERSVGRAAE